LFLKFKTYNPHYPHPLYAIFFGLPLNVQAAVNNTSYILYVEIYRCIFPAF